MSLVDFLAVNLYSHHFPRIQEAVIDISVTDHRHHDKFSVISTLELSCVTDGKDYKNYVNSDPEMNVSRHCLIITYKGYVLIYIRVPSIS